MIQRTVVELSNSWIDIAALMSAFLLLVLALKVYSMAACPHPEVLRKMLHVGSGLMTLSFPFLFPRVWPVVLLTTATTLLLAAVKFRPGWKRRFGEVLGDAGRKTLGELYFPVAVAIVFCLAHGDSPLLFVVPILVLTIADAACALVGMRLGPGPLPGGKTIEGSFAFFLTAFFCIQVPLLAWSGIERLDVVLIAATSASVLTALEALASRGVDNLIIPVGGYFLLSASFGVDTEVLGMRLAAIVAVGALLGAIVLVRTGSPVGSLPPEGGSRTWLRHFRLKWKSHTARFLGAEAGGDTSMPEATRALGTLAVPVCSRSFRLQPEERHREVQR